MDVTDRTRDRPATATLWFALLGGMSAYAVHLVVGFWIVPALCGLDRPGAVDWLVAGTTVLAAAVAVAATVAAVRARRQVRAQDRRPGDRRRSPVRTQDAPVAAWDISAGTSPARFMTVAGIWLNLLGLALILLGGLPHLVVPPCA